MLRFLNERQIQDLQAPAVLAAADRDRGDRGREGDRDRDGSARSYHGPTVKRGAGGRGGYRGGGRGDSYGWRGRGRSDSGGGRFSGQKRMR